MAETIKQPDFHDDTDESWEAYAKDPEEREAEEIARQEVKKQKDKKLKPDLRSLEERRQQQKRKKKIASAVKLVYSGNEKKETLGHLELIKDQLMSNFGVENLSSLEEFRLKKIIDQCTKERKQMIADGYENSESGIQVESESVARWFQELYGIKIYEVYKFHASYIIEDKTTGEKFVFESGQKYESQQKEKSLEKQGHDVVSRKGISESFKDYLRKKRDEAHNYNI